MNASISLFATGIVSLSSKSCALYETILMNCRQKDAKKKSSESQQQASYVALKGEDRKRRKVTLPAGDRRYEALKWTRSINVKLKEWET